jgi:hypothetical protein
MAEKWQKNGIKWQKNGKKSVTVEISLLRCTSIEVKEIS